MTSTLAPGWKVETSRGPNWLFVKLSGPKQGDSPAGNGLADYLLSILDQHLTYRMVLDVTDLPVLCEGTIGELVRLQNLVGEHEGILRLSGLSQENRQLLRSATIDACLPDYPNVEKAIMRTPADI